MKRALACLLFAVCTTVALAQAPFTIVRPADGSKVREVVHILFPRDSVPKGGYVGIFVNKKFIEATVPPDDGKYLDYALDTKDLGIPEGPTTIEAVLYINFAERPRIVDRSSVQVSLSNTANIAVPNQGINLRYRWVPDNTWVYDLDETTTQFNITEAQALMGAHAAEQPVNHFRARMNFEVDNVYDDGDALLRVQMEPPPGTNSFLVPLSGETTPRRLFETNLYPVYMRLHRTGFETYGLIPSYWPLGSGTENVFNAAVNVIAPTALPLLPVGKVKPSDSWFTRILLPSSDDLDRERVLQKNSLFDSLPARGEFLGVEWEMGYPCAKIRNTFSVGSGGAGVGRDKIKNDAVSVEETYWFALDRGVIVRFERTIVRDQASTAQPTNPAGGASPGGASFNSAKFGRGGTGAESVTPDFQFGGKFRGGGGGVRPGQRGAIGGGSYARNRGAAAPTANVPPPSAELQRVTDTRVYTLVP